MFDSYKYRLTHGPADAAVWRQLYRQTQGTRPPKGWRCARCPEQLTLYDGVRPVSFMGMLARDVTINGVGVRVGGMGYGATHPDYTGQGCLRRILVEGALRFHAQGYPAMFLTCLDALIPYYVGTLGWTDVSNAAITIVQPDTGEQAMPGEVHLCARVLDGERLEDEGLWPIRTIHLGGLPW